MFHSPREALQNMYQRHRGRGHRSQTYSDRVIASHIPESEEVLVASLLYGEGHGCRNVSRAQAMPLRFPDRLQGWLADLTLHAWCFNRCYICGGNTVYGDDHRCDEADIDRATRRAFGNLDRSTEAAKASEMLRALHAGKVFWNPARRRVVQNVEKWLYRSLRKTGLLEPPTRPPPTKRQIPAPEDVVLAFDEDRRPVDGHDLQPPRTLAIDDSPRKT